MLFAEVGEKFVYCFFAVKQKYFNKKPLSTAWCIRLR